MALPMPRLRQAGARLIRISHAWAPLTVATAQPARSSPTGQALLPGNHSHHLQAGVVWIMQLLCYPV